ncbi:hypothetical protein ACQEVZ_48990 [Dactylosporangium sp. CA-152071]|uniref:hypothetical protein n=1 Tax=Dactylosporangium sp. CA-152071 TaxID=3239933 RepID=UPI003D9373F3
MPRVAVEDDQGARGRQAAPLQQPDAGPALDRIRTEYTEVAAVCEALAGELSRSAP